MLKIEDKYVKERKKALFFRVFRKDKTLINIALQGFFERLKINWQTEPPIRPLKKVSEW